MSKPLIAWVLTLLLSLFVLASCASQTAKPKYVFPDVPPVVQCPSAKALNGGIWLNEKDSKALLKERAKLRSVIEELKRYYERTQ